MPQCDSPGFLQLPKLEVSTTVEPVYTALTNQAWIDPDRSSQQGGCAFPVTPYSTKVTILDLACNTVFVGERVLRLLLRCAHAHMHAHAPAAMP